MFPTGEVGMGHKLVDKMGGDINKPHTHTLAR